MGFTPLRLMNWVAHQDLSLGKSRHTFCINHLQEKELTCFPVSPAAFINVAIAQA